MAVDEAILLTAEGAQSPTLRFYRWRAPTLSLGYFQRSGDVPHELSRLPMVRRLSGGGAIVHDRELTYSLVVPPGMWPRSVLSHLVRDVHSAVRRAAPLLQPAVVIQGIEPKPFLCFERRSAQDLVLGNSKIVGSAQRNRRGTVLQHGSILESRSDAACHLAGLADLTSDTIDDDRIGVIVEALADEWGWQFRPGQLSDEEKRIASDLERSKYLSDEWNRRR